MPPCAICVFVTAYVVTAASIYSLYMVVEMNKSLDTAAAAILSATATMFSCTCVAAHAVALKNYASCCIASLRVEAERRVEVSRAVDHDIYLAEVV